MDPPNKKSSRPRRFSLQALPLAQGRWGYEGAQATIVYGMPAFRWADDVEDLVNAGARRVVGQVQVPAK
jgi:hypothetical protein